MHINAHGDESSSPITHKESSLNVNAVTLWDLEKASMQEQPKGRKPFSVDHIDVGEVPASPIARRIRLSVSRAFGTVLLLMALASAAMSQRAWRGEFVVVVAPPVEPD